MVVEGVLDGQGEIKGNLEANKGSLIEITGTTTPAGTQQIILNPTQDTRSGEDDPNYNDGRLSVGRDSDLGLQRSALEFDLTQFNLPVGGIVTDVQMLFTVGLAGGRFR